MVTQPRAHRDPAFLAAKLRRVDDPHIRPLNDLARRIAAEADEAVPWFDPASGGTAAEVLLLLEAPGRRATAGRGSGIVSPDNDDETAAALHELLRKAGLARDRAVIWNIVPWYIGTATSIRAADAEDLRRAQPYLHALLGLLPRLRVVVVLGDAARSGWFHYLRRADSSFLPTLAASHPSPQVLRIRPERRDEIRDTLRRAARVGPSD